MAERNLRLLIGIDLADGRLIRPIEEPSTAEVLFQWDEISTEALVRRAELERQRRIVKRRELELAASKNFLKPRLDVISRYRWRGFGKDLMGGACSGDEPFDDALSNLLDGDFQEWALGMELNFPNGFRQAHAGVQNALLRLARERAVLGQQERQILHDLGNSFADMKRAYADRADEFQPPRGRPAGTRRPARPQAGGAESGLGPIAGVLAPRDRRRGPTAPVAGRIRDGGQECPLRKRFAPGLQPDPICRRTLGGACSGGELARPAAT